MPTWLIILIVAIVVLAVGGIIARNRQLARTRPAFDRALTHVDRDLAAAAATDRGWDREHLHAAARRISAEQFGAEPDEVTLIEVIDRPGTDDDQAVFDVTTGAEHRHLTLGRREGHWVAAEA